MGYINSVVYEAKEGKRPNTREAVFRFILDTDIDKMNNAYVGKKRQSCKICNKTGNYGSWIVKEMFVGKRDEFIYFECSYCQTLQIENFPKNINEYYAHDYYSYKKPKIESLRSGVAKDERMILDVGCGSGQWLCMLASLGFVNLFGCDPFLPNGDIIYPNGVKIYKKQIHDMDGQYDIIRLYDSFEHMGDPHDVFVTLNRLLKPSQGYYYIDEPRIEMKIPIYPNIAWDMYGVFWYQIDAPRHFFLYSIKSIKLLATQYGFDVSSISYQKAGCPLYMNKQYQNDISLINHNLGIADSNAFGFGNMDMTNDYFNLLSKLAILTGTSDTIAFNLTRENDYDKI